MVTFWTGVWSFIKVWWKEILAVVLLAITLIYIVTLRTKLGNRDEEISNLKFNVQVVESALDNRDKIIEIQQKSMKIFEALSEKEREADVVHKQTIIKNKEVIREYVESKKDPEDLKKLYDYENNQWNEIKTLVEWYKDAPENE